jgi:hypothetical protein
MIALEHVKRRFRRRVVAIATGIAATGVLTMGIVAFLGRHVGTFTIALDTAHVELSLSKTSDFADPQSYLYVNEMHAYSEFKYSGLPSSSEIDNEETDHTLGAIRNPDTGEITSMKFFKYTFFLRNVGMTPASYTMKVLIYDDTPATDGRLVSDTLRLQLYANDAESPDSHESKFSAKPAVDNNVDPETGEETPSEYVSAGPERPSEYFGLCERFESDSVITTYSVPIMDRDETTRFTLVAWLDGYDPQSKSSLNAPLGATIRLGVEINAYETK